MRAGHHDGDAAAGATGSTAGTAASQAGPPRAATAGSPRAGRASPPEQSPNRPRPRQAPSGGAGERRPGQQPAAGADLPRPRRELDEPDALRLLREGDIDLEGRLVDASNTTLRGLITVDGLSAWCVYKPIRGERPLWDFPEGSLAGREVAAYLVSDATGWDLVPPTVLRDGPLGPGSCQLWIDEDGDAEPLLGFVPARRVPRGWHRVLAAQDTDGRPYVLAHADDERLARLAAFDAVINNADRKGGHVLVTQDGHVYGVDHGVTFHVQDKLRTVLWGWAGQRLPAPVTGTLAVVRAEVDGELGERLSEHLTRREVRQVGNRIDRMLDTGRFPGPDDRRPSVPWPPV